MKNRVAEIVVKKQSFSSLGKLLALGNASFVGLQSEGVKKGTLSSALYAAKAFDLVRSGHLLEAEYDALTFQECLAIARVMSDRSKVRLTPAAVAAVIRGTGDLVNELASLFQHGMTIAERERETRPKGVYYDPERCAYLAYHKRQGLQVYAYFAVKDFGGSEGAKAAAEIQRERFVAMGMDELAKYKGRNIPVTEHERWLGDDMAPSIAARVNYDPEACVRKGFEAGLLAVRVLSQERAPMFLGRRNGREMVAA